MCTPSRAGRPADRENSRICVSSWLWRADRTMASCSPFISFSKQSKSKYDSACSPCKRVPPCSRRNSRTSSSSLSPIEMYCSRRSSFASTYSQYPAATSSPVNLGSGPTSGPLGFSETTDRFSTVLHILSAFHFLFFSNLASSASILSASSVNFTAFVCVFPASPKVLSSSRTSFNLFCSLAVFLASSSSFSTRVRCFSLNHESLSMFGWTSSSSSDRSMLSHLE
mmetsp:Transcript_16603/g.29529  ORF Transcript_16603/g.29529 Transcript_16603/m.29529 type:complete len:225 (+) Transcript_16603:427-1101(+)